MPEIPLQSTVIKFKEKVAQIYQSITREPLFINLEEIIENPNSGRRVRRHFYEEDAFTSQMLARIKDTPWSEVDKEIAEWHFRRPIPILGLPWAIRPFWRDAKQAPPLLLHPPKGRGVYWGD